MAVKKTKQQVLSELKQLCTSRDHSYELIKYVNTVESEISFSCNKHQKAESHSFKQYQQSRWGLSCCALLRIQRSSTKEKRKDILLRKVELLAKQRNHLISKFQFENRRDCFFSVCCKTHNTTHPLMHYRNYASSNVKWGAPCCAYPLFNNHRKDKRLEEQIKNRVRRWRRSLCPSKQERWCCEVTGLMSQNIKNTGKLHVQAHHLYGGQGYPNVMFVKQNGILLVNTFHLEFHKKVRKARDITPDSFLLFLKQLRTDRAYLLNCLKDLRQSLIRNTRFEERVPCVHPVTSRSAYKIKSKINQGDASVIVPCSLLDNAETPDLSDINKQIDLLIRKIGGIQPVLEAYKDDQLIVLEDEQNHFLSYLERIS